MATPSMKVPYAVLGIVTTIALAALAGSFTAYGKFKDVQSQATQTDQRLQMHSNALDKCLISTIENHEKITVMDSRFGYVEKALQEQKRAFEKLTDQIRLSNGG